MAWTAWQLPALSKLAVPAVCLLIVFLACSSQYLFYHLDPAPLTTKETFYFNILVVAAVWSYERACRVDPGRLPKAIYQAQLEGKSHSDVAAHASTPVKRADEGIERRRWCKKCEAVKPPRAHHCRQCARCIPKMDHHCPWTSNCVSHNTFPHFLRFIYYTCASLSLLAYFLSIRLLSVWRARHLPSYLGPSIWALTHLFALSAITFLLLFALIVLLVTATHSLATNTTMIESWEIERHEALIEKGRYLGGHVPGPGGRRVRIQRQEFPYDIGIWRNLVQGMGGANPIAWILPFGGGPSNEVGWGPWEENGFEDPGTVWPPIDPDKMPRGPPIQDDERRVRGAFIHGDEDDVRAFRRRQMEDYKRFETVRGRQEMSFVDVGEDGHDGGEGEGDSDEDIGYEEGMDGEVGWTNSDGDRLRDYGVDEDAEEILVAIDDDDIPLGELMRRRRAGRGDGVVDG